MFTPICELPISTQPTTPTYTSCLGFYMPSSKATSVCVCVCVCPLYRDPQVLICDRDDVTCATCVHISESVRMCIFVVNPVDNLKLVTLKVICVIKQRKKKGNVYLSLVTHIIQICALRFYLLSWASCSSIAKAHGVERQ